MKLKIFQNLPYWWNYIATDPNGKIWCFENEPYINEDCNEWKVPNGRVDLISHSEISGDWRESLTKRPDKQEENKVDENKLPVIDISKTFQAYVWDGDNKPRYNGCDDIREIVATFSSGGCIDSNLAVWEHFELIKEPTFRKFRDLDEFIQWLRDTGRTDTRYIDFKGAFWGSINVTPVTNFELLLMCKWFNNGEPIGIKE